MAQPDRAALTATNSARKTNGMGLDTGYGLLG